MHKQGNSSLFDKLLTLIYPKISEFQTISKKYQLLTENLAASVMIRDLEGQTTYCSPYTEVLTGWPLAEIQGAPQDLFMHIAHEQDREKLRRAFKIVEAGESFQFQFRFYHKTGIEMWAETRTVPIFDQNDQVVSSLSITLDVTASVRYQRQVEDHNRNLQDFAYMVSHDLKAPIFTIKGMCGVLREELGSVLSQQLEASQALDHINQASLRLEGLVNGVLQYSRISLEKIEFESVDLNEVFADLTVDFSKHLQEAQAIFDIAERLPVIKGHRLHVYQILSNLLGNALKYRSRERPIKISVALFPHRDPRMVCLGISDNGIGIPNDKLDLIFRPFQRIHQDKIEGTGIGLACVKKLLERLGGDVQVESKVGVGSTFQITFCKSEET